MYTLMHDPVYRDAVAWQNSAYNQPPHLSFLLSDTAKWPKPDIALVGGPAPSGIRAIDAAPKESMSATTLARGTVVWLDARGAVLGTEELWMNPASPRPVPRSIRAGIQFARVEFAGAAPQLVRCVRLDP